MKIIKACTFLSYQKRQIDIVNRVIHETFLIDANRYLFVLS